MASRSDYIRSLNQMRENYQSSGNPYVNPANDSTKPSTDISSYSVPSATQAASSGSGRYANGNWWQRTVDTANDFAGSVATGLLDFVDGIGDFFIGLAGSIGEAFGADTSGFDDAMQYDWQSQAVAFMDQADFAGKLATGEVFSQSYWDDWRMLGSVEGSRAILEETKTESWINEMGENRQYVDQAGEVIGQAIPSVLLNIFLPGSGAAATAMAAAGGVSAAGNQISDKRSEGYSYGQSLASGAISGVIEAGTELLPIGNMVGGYIKPGAKLANSVAGRLGQAFVEEGSEEFVGELLGFLADIPTEGFQKSWEESYGSWEAFGNTLKDAAVSFAYGGLGGLVGGSVNEIRTRVKYGSSGSKLVSLLGEASDVQEQAQEKKAKGQSTEAEEARLAEIAQEFVDEADRMANDPKEQTHFQTLLKDLASGDPGSAIASNSDERAKPDGGTSSPEERAFSGQWISSYSGSESPAVRALAEQVSELNLPVSVGTEEDFDGLPEGTTAFIQRNGSGEPVAAVVRPGTQAGSDFFGSYARSSVEQAALGDAETAGELASAFEAIPKLKTMYAQALDEARESIEDMGGTASEEAVRAKALASLAGQYASREGEAYSSIGSAIEANPSLGQALSRFLGEASERASKGSRLFSNILSEASGEAGGSIPPGGSENLPAPEGPERASGEVSSSRESVDDGRTADEVKDRAKANNPYYYDRAGAERAVRKVVSSLSEGEGRVMARFSGEGVEKASERLFRAVNKPNAAPEEVASALRSLFSNLTIEQNGETMEYSDLLGEEAETEVAREAVATYLREGKLSPAEKFARLLAGETSRLKEEIRRVRERNSLMNSAIRQIEKAMDRYKSDKKYGREEANSFQGLLTIARESPFYKEYSRNGDLWRTTSISGKAGTEWAANAAASVERAVEAGAIGEMEGEALSSFLSVLNEPQGPRGTLSNAQIEAVGAFYKALVRFTNDQAMERREALRSEAQGMNDDLGLRARAYGRNRGSSSLRGAGYDLLRQNSVFDIALGTSDNPVSQELRKVERAREDYYQRKMEWTERYLPEGDQGRWERLFSGFGRIDFKGVKLTKQEAMAVLTPFLDPQTRSEWTAEKGRYVEVGSKYLHISEEDIRTLEDFVGKEAVDFATEKLRSVFGDRSEGNVTSAVRDFQMRTYGSTLVDERADYVPRWASRGHLKAGGLGTTNTSQPQQQAANSNGNLTKERAESQAVGVLRPIFPTEAIEAYIDMAANEVELKKPTSEALSMLRLTVESPDGSPVKVGMALNSVVKDGASRYQDILSSLNGMGIGYQDGFVSKIVGNATLATFALNVPTAFRNLLSVSKVPSEVGLWNSLKSVVTGKVFNLSKYAGWLRNDPVWWARYHNSGYLRAAATIGEGDVATKFERSKIGKWLGKTVLAEYGDRLATLIEFSFHASTAEIENPGKSQSEIREIALSSWHSAVNRYQSTNEAVGKSRAQLGKFAGRPSGVAREFLRFSSDSTASATMILGGMAKASNAAKLAKGLERIATEEGLDTAIGKKAMDMRAKILSGGKKDLSRDVIVGLVMLIVAGLGETAIGDLFDRLFGRKEWNASFGDGNLAQEVLGNAAENLLPMYRSLSYAIGNGGGVELYATSVPDQAIAAIRKLMSILEDAQDGEIGQEKWGTAFYEAAKAVGTYLGIPVSNIYNLAVGIPSSFNAEFALKAGDWLYGYSESSFASRLASAAKTGNLARAEHYAYALGSSRLGTLSERASDEMARLKVAGYDALPAALPETDGEGNAWGDRALSAMEGKWAEAGKAIDQTIALASYARLSDKEKAKALSNVENAYRNAAVAKAEGKEPTSKLARLAYLGASKIGKLASAMAAVPSGEGKEAASSAAARVPGLSRGERAVVLWLMGYSLDQEQRDLAASALNAMGLSLSEALGMVG